MAILKVLAYKDDPYFRGVFIRQTSTQHRQAGGLWQEMQENYKHFGAKFRQDNMTVIFPSGAQVQLKVSASEKDTKNFDGGQYSMVVFDEAQWHTQEEITYLLSRIRSKAKGPHSMSLTCNPLRDSFLYKFVQWYLDMDTGIPIPEKSGTQRWFAQFNGDFVFGDTSEELTEKYGNKIRPMTYKFIAANIYSNPVIIERNPDYLARLENLKKVERERLLLGSWHAKEEGAAYFEREWVELVDRPPEKVTGRVRSYDLAATEVSEANKDPDWTAGVKMSRDVNGIYYIEDVYRFRKRSGEVIEEIVKTAYQDGVNDCQVTIPRDPGQAGKSYSQHMIKVLAENGVIASCVQTSGHSSKLNRFLPFAQLAQSGSVRVVRGDWNEDFFKELESFTGQRTKAHVHDDE